VDQNVRVEKNPHRLRRPARAAFCGPIQYKANMVVYVSANQISGAEPGIRGRQCV
jgi:hypothetical protein